MFVITFMFANKLTNFYPILIVAFFFLRCPEKEKNFQFFISLSEFDVFLFLCLKLRSKLKNLAGFFSKFFSKNGHSLFFLGFLKGQTTLREGERERNVRRLKTKVFSRYFDLSRNFYTREIEVTGERREMRTNMVFRF